MTNTIIEKIYDEIDFIKDLADRLEDSGQIDSNTVANFIQAVNEIYDVVRAFPPIGKFSYRLARPEEWYAGVVFHRHELVEMCPDLEKQILAAPDDTMQQVAAELQDLIVNQWYWDNLKEATLTVFAQEEENDEHDN